MACNRGQSVKYVKLCVLCTISQEMGVRPFRTKWMLVISYEMVPGHFVRNVFPIYRGLGFFIWYELEKL